MSRYTDLERPPLHENALRRALIVPGGLWTDLVLHEQTTSTNADVVAAARDGAPEGLVVVAERQSAGRGRLDRRWESPARAGLAVSVLLRPGPEVPISRYGWLPLLAGVALALSVAQVSRVDARLKWPNDLLVGGRKCGGILGEAVHGGQDGPAVVVGIGLNVSVREGELPHPQATSLRLAGADEADRDPLLRALLRTFADLYLPWRAAAGDPQGTGLREGYLALSDTVGREVTVTLPDGSADSGLATTVDTDGRLVVRSTDGVARTYAAGDVVHARPAD